MNPAVRGMPASDSRHIVKPPAKRGFLYARPLNDSMESSPVLFICMPMAAHVPKLVNK